MFGFLLRKYWMTIQNNIEMFVDHRFFFPVPVQVRQDQFPIQRLRQEGGDLRNVLISDR